MLLNLRTNRYHSLNETGARVWQLLVEGQGDGDIARTLTMEYDVTEQVATAELERHHRRPERGPTHRGQ